MLTICFCSHSFSESPLHLWVLADWSESVGWCHRPALPALPQPHLRDRASPGDVFDCSGEPDQTAVAPSRRRSRRTETDGGLWWTGRVRQRATCQRGGWGEGQERASNCRLPLLPVSVVHRRLECQVALEDGGSLGCSLFAQNRLPCQMSAQRFQLRANESLLECLHLPLCPPPDHQHMPAKAMPSPCTDAENKRQEAVQPLQLKPPSSVVCTSQACASWDARLRAAENRKQLHG